MEDIVNTIIEKNKILFGDNPRVEKINVGFTNTIYNVDDKYIIKLCTKISNEESFKKEIDFYNKNKENTLIPQLYIANTDKKDVPYYYEILEKIEGITLYNVWHTYNESQREDIIKQLCDAMKLMHKNKSEQYDWSGYMKSRFIPLYEKAKDNSLFISDEIKLLDEAYSLFDKYLESDEFVLVHNDLHFDNIFINNGKIKVIDFERSKYAPRDYELAIFYRMVRQPWKFASEETEDYTDIKDYENIMSYVSKYYKELMDTPNLYKRLAIYDIVYFLKDIIDYPELKEDVMSAVKIVLS